jgi:hypothetical protein
MKTEDRKAGPSLSTEGNVLAGFAIFAFLAVKPFRVFGVFRAGESRISCRNKKDLLNHVFIQDPFFVSVGME